jgi:hypothetical protein
MIYEISASSLTQTTPLCVYCRTPGGSTSEECDELDPTRLTPFIRHNHFGFLDIDYAQRLVTVSLRSADPSIEARAAGNNQSDHVVNNVTTGIDNSASLATLSTRRIKQATTQKNDEQQPQHRRDDDDDTSNNVLA